MESIESLLSLAVKELYGLEISPELSRPDAEFGDYSSNIAMKLARDLGRSPREIATDIVNKLSGDLVASAEVAGPGFINITVTDQALLKQIDQQPSKIYDNDTVVIETNNPNPFKAMHIGHAFNAVLGDTIANLIEQGGANTYRVSYHGDIGTHVGRSMYSLLKFVSGNPAKLDEIVLADRNSFMSKMYAEGSTAAKEDESARADIERLAEMSFTREDPVYAAVYDTIFAWSFEQIDETVKRLGNKPVQERFLESDAESRGVKIVQDNTPGVFQESGGALIFKGSEYGSFDNAFVSSKGNGLYAARDLGLMQLKNEQYHPDKSFIVTAEEQRDYFKGVIAAAELCMPDQKDVTVNISTGTVKLSSGKMSSRDGNVIEISWLFDQIAEAINKTGGNASDEMIAGALRYEFLKVRIGSDVVFDIEQSVSIQGNSGPYLQYAYARANSVVAKATETSSSEVDGLQPDERLLARKISMYAEVVDQAAYELMPHHICNYLFELAQQFNRFYEKNRVIGDEREALRLALVKSYLTTLKNGLDILGIHAPEKM